MKQLSRFSDWFINRSKPPTIVNIIDLILPDTDGLIGEAAGEPIGESAGPLAAIKVFKNISNNNFTMT